MMKKYFDILINDINQNSLKEEVVPVGAMLVYQNEIISKHMNGRDVLSHAEMLALKEGQEKLGPQIKDAILYVTLEPCAMCKAAISLSGIKKVYFGAYNDKSVIDANVAYYGGFYEKECGDALKVFFKSKRFS